MNPKIALSETQKELLAGIREIAGREIPANENLLAGSIDSLSWVELINLMDEIAKAKSIPIDLEALLLGKELTINQLLEKLGEEKLP